MATRTVSTKLAIQGEEQYKSSIKTINSTLATLKSELTFSKLLVFAVLFIDYKATMVTLDLCYIAVANNYTGSLPYLTALIAFLQAATATVLSFSLNKSKAENTTGGITYEANIKRDC